MKKVFIIEAVQVLQEDHIDDVVLTDYETGLPLLFESKDKASEWIERVMHSDDLYGKMSPSDVHQAIRELRNAYWKGEISEKDYQDARTLYLKTMTEITVYRKDIKGYQIKALNVL